MDKNKLKWERGGEKSHCVINSRTLCAFRSERGDLGAGASYQWTVMIQSEVPLKRKFTDTIKRVIWFIQTIVLARSFRSRSRFSSRQFLSPFGTKPSLRKKKARFIYLKCSGLNELQLITVWNNQVSREHLSLSLSFFLKLFSLITNFINERN